MIDGGSSFKENKQNTETPEVKSSALDKLQDSLEKATSKIAEMFSDDYKDSSENKNTESTDNNENTEKQDLNEEKQQDNGIPTFKELFERLFSDDFIDGMNSLHETSENDNSEADVEKTPIQNKQDGLRREADVEEELKEKYPPEEGYTIEKEVYLRDKDGNIVRDPITGEARRIDFVVIKDGVVIDSIEVTSKTADKTEQSAKESRIREAGGNYIKDSNGNLVEIPDSVQTRIERRD